MTDELSSPPPAQIGSLDLPTLNRKQIIRKIDICRKLIQQTGCHLVHLADTYKKTGNDDHSLGCTAVLVSLDATEEMLDNLNQMV